MLLFKKRIFNGKLYNFKYLSSNNINFPWVEFVSKLYKKLRTKEYLKMS